MPTEKEINLIRVVLVDDHAGVRARIRQLLESESDIEVVSEASNGREALKLIQAQQPDVVLLDLELPDIKGLEIARRLHTANFPARILAVSSYDDPHYIQGMLDNGAAGYITKEEAAEVLVEAVRHVSHQETPWISRRAAAQLAILQPASVTDALTLTELEIEILRAIVRGETDEAIGTSLGLTDEAVKAGLKTIFTRLNVSSRSEAARRAVQDKLI